MDIFRTIAFEKMYLWLTIPIGLLFLFLNPPFQVPDEAAHYFKSLNLAQGRVVCTQDEVSAPANYVSLPDDVQLVKIKGEKEKKVSGSAISDGLMIPASEESMVVPQSICNAYPIGHIIQAIGLKIGILTHAPPLIAFYLGRVFVLVSAVFLVFSAIRIVPFGKLIFVIFGLLPITMQQFGSFSYDAVHFGLVFLFTAYLLKLVNAPKLSVRDGWILLGLSLLAFNAKPGYFLLSLLVLVLPKAKFENAKKYWLYTLGFVLASFLFFGLGRVVFNEQGTFPKDVDPQAQMEFVVNNPIEFSYTIFHSIYKNHMFYFETFFLKPGWMNSSLPELLYVFMAIGAVLLLRSHHEAVNLTKHQRLVIFVTFLAQTLFVFLSLYLIWTPVEYSHVQGIQGRYFLAIMPLFILSFYKSKFSFRSEWIKNNIQVALVIFVLMMFIFVFLDIKDLYYKDFSEYLR